MSTHDDILEILPAGSLVELPGGKKIEVIGVPLSDLGKLIRRFPELVDQMFTGSTRVADMMVSVPDAVVPLIASGIGRLGDKAVEDRLARLSAYHQLSLFTAVIRETMPDGHGPFLERVKNAAVALGFDLSRFGNLTSDSPNTASKSPETDKASPAPKRKSA